MPSVGFLENPYNTATYLQDRIIFENYIIHFCKQTRKKFPSGWHGQPGLSPWQERAL